MWKEMMVLDQPELQADLKGLADLLHRQGRVPGCNCTRSLLMLATGRASASRERHSSEPYICRQGRQGCRDPRAAGEAGGRCQGGARSHDQDSSLQSRLGLPPAAATQGLHARPAQACLSGPSSRHPRLRPGASFGPSATLDWCNQQPS